MTASKRTFSALAFAGILIAAPSSQAVTVSYTIDPGLSSLTLSGDVTVPGAGVFPFGPQFGDPGSMTASYAGGLTGDLIGSTFTFSAGSLAALANPSGPFAPPASSVGPDNYGILFGPGGAAPVGYRAIEFGPVGSVTSGAAPASSLLGFLPLSYADYDATALGGGPGTVDLTLLPASVNASPGLVGISILGLTETLTIPVSVTYTGIVAGAPFTSKFDGLIVATRPIPEPSAVAFGLVGMVGLLLRRKR